MLPELPECSHWWKCPFTPGEEIERLRGEVELLRHERDALKSLLRDVQEMTDKRWPGFASLKKRIAEAIAARGE